MQSGQLGLVTAGLPEMITIFETIGSYRQSTIADGAIFGHFNLKRISRIAVQLVVCRLCEGFAVPALV